ncbi:alpha/beta hydrolase [Variovorax sp. LjRoot84]|uniref:alpha/beta hydrolase n=1 Tax=Variovorax sp. LjRoot84 TaxID=3342340 RepID=UPI003ECFF221
MLLFAAATAILAGQGCAIDVVRSPQVPVAAVTDQKAAQQIPARLMPVPGTVSPQLRTMIAGGPSPIWNAHPKSTEEWRTWVQQRAEGAVRGLPALRQKLEVTVEPSVIAGVKVFTVAPRVTSPENLRRVLVHVHGGGYVLNPGEAGTSEAILMAGFGHFKVVSIDYRMPPDHPYPAALDDAMAVYREVVKSTDPSRVAIFGTSTGGGLALAMVLRAKREGLPLPAAVAPGTPWSDMTKTGDSYFTNEMVDNVLVSHDGWLGDAAALYANGHDLKDPLLSPVYGDLAGFPPTLLTTGTRDLFLSNTVRVTASCAMPGSWQTSWCSRACPMRSTCSTPTRRRPGNISPICGPSSTAISHGDTARASRPHQAAGPVA